MRDIYSGQPIVTPSQEHVVQDAIGGRLESANLIDKTTNDSLGQSIDAALARSLQIFRTLIDGKSGSGRTAPLLRGARGADGVTYDLRSGGKAELGRQKILFSEQDGEVVMHVEVRDVSELRRLAIGALAKRGVSPARLEESLRSVVSTRKAAPAMKVDVTLGAEFWRAVAKVACNMLALERRDLFLDPVFDPVRSFVLKGGDDTWSFVSLNCEPLLVGQSLGDLDHLVVVRGERKTGEVRALVVFYGYLEFVVRVGSTRIAEDFSTAYRVNQIAHTDRRDAPEDTAIAVPPFEPLTMASEARWGAAYQLAISNAMLDAHRVADKRAIAHVAQLVAQDFRAGVTWVSDVAMQDSMLRHLDEHYPVLAERWRARRPK